MATQGGVADPAGLSTLTFGVNYAAFSRNLSGSEEVDARFTDRIDASLFDVSLRHHFDRWLAASLRLPVGSVRVDPLGASPTTVAGLGDLELAADYELGRLWRLGGKRPSLRMGTTLRLPSGESSRVEDAANDVPPNLIAIGQGAVSVGFDLRLTQPLSRSWSLRGRAAVLKPLTYNPADLNFGTSASGAAGILYRAHDKLLVTVDSTARYRRRTRNRNLGELINSGGFQVGGQFGVTLLASDELALGASMHVPVYQNVKGTQIAETFSASLFAAVTFGAKEREHGEHGEHGEHAEHGDVHEHKDAHEHRDEQEPVGGGDIQNLASGGESFAVDQAALEGRVVVIDFWAEWCAPCRTIDALLAALAREHPALAVRRVEVPTFDAPVAKEHLSDARGLPVVWILARDGTVAHRLVQPRPQELKQTLLEVLGANSE